MPEYYKQHANTGQPCNPAKYRGFVRRTGNRPEDMTNIPHQSVEYSSILSSPSAEFSLIDISLYPFNARKALVSESKCIPLSFRITVTASPCPFVRIHGLQEVRAH